MKKEALIDRVILGIASSSEVEALQLLMTMDNSTRYDFHDVNLVIVNSSQHLEATRDETYYNGWRQVQHLMGKVKRRRKLLKNLQMVLLMMFCTLCLAICLMFWISEPKVITFRYADNGFANVHRAVLPDGSTIVLRGNSSFKYYHIPFVRLLQVRGDVRIEVSPNTSKPFYLMNGLGTIQLTDGAFFARIYQKEYVKLYVTRGDAAIRYHEKRFFVNAGENITLLPSTALDKTMKTEKNFDAWYTGTIIFDATPLETTFSELGEEFNVLIVLRDVHVRGQWFTGTFHRTQTVEDILEILSKQFDFTYFLESPGIYVVDRKSGPNEAKSKRS